MSEFGSMNVADSLKASWVDGEGKPLMSKMANLEMVSPDKQLYDRIVALEAGMADLRSIVNALSDKVLPTESPPKKTKKVKK